MDEGYDIQRLNFLIVDDNKHMCLLVKGIINALGSKNTVEASDGAEALDYLYRRGQFADRPNVQPVVILIDLKMPRVDGLEVLRQVKSDPALKTIPIVVLTSSREDQDIIDSYNLGVNAYVVKPVAFDAFMAAVKQLGLFWVLTNQAPPF